LLTPQECAKKFRQHAIKDIGAALLIIIAFIFAIAVVVNQFMNGNGFISITFGFGAILTGYLFKLCKPGKIGELTTKMHFDWQELSKGLRQYNLLYHDDNVNEQDFAHLIECKFKELVESIMSAECREEDAVKTKLREKLSKLHRLCGRLNLDLPKYEDLYKGKITATWVRPSRGATIVILPSQ
jgi:hypothetical protein